MHSYFYIILFNLPLLYTTATIKEDRLTYDTLMRTFKSLLTLEGYRYRAGFIPRVSLQVHIALPWRYLYESGNDQALITKTDI